MTTSKVARNDDVPSVNASEQHGLQFVAVGSPYLRNEDNNYAGYTRPAITSSKDSFLMGNVKRARVHPLPQQRPQAAIKWPLVQSAVAGQQVCRFAEGSQMHGELARKPDGHDGGSNRRRDPHNPTAAPCPSERRHRLPQRLSTLVDPVDGAGKAHIPRQWAGNAAGSCSPSGLIGKLPRRYHMGSPGLQIKAAFQRPADGRGPLFALDPEGTPGVLDGRLAGGWRRGQEPRPPRHRLTHGL